MTRANEAIAFLRRNVKELHEIRKDFPNSWTDKEVEERMYGHSMWDDPPQGYSTNLKSIGYQKLIAWSRGYLDGRSVQAGNDAGLIEFGLYGIAPEPVEEVNQKSFERANRRFVREYAFYLQRELDEFVLPEDGERSLLRHTVQIIASPTVTAVTVEFVRRERLECWNRFESWLETASASGFTIFREADDRAIAYQYSEQPLSNTEMGVHLRQAEDEAMSLQICHPSDLHFWSNVQAWQDSNDAIALMLAQRGGG